MASRDAARHTHTHTDTLHTLTHSLTPILSAMASFRYPTIAPPSRQTAIAAHGEGFDRSRMASIGFVLSLQPDAPSIPHRNAQPPARPSPAAATFGRNGAFWCISLHARCNRTPTAQLPARPGPVAETFGQNGTLWDIFGHRLVPAPLTFPVYSLEKERPPQRTGRVRV